MSWLFGQQQSLDDEENKGKCGGIRLQTEDKTEYSQNTGGQGDALFPAQLARGRAGLERQRQNSPYNQKENKNQAGNFYIGRSAQQKERNSPHFAVCPLGKKRQKQKQPHAAVQQPKQQGTGAALVLAVFRFGNRQQGIAGKQVVQRNMKKLRNCFQGFQIRVPAARFP